MASFHLTPSQYAAVHARGDSILVSAGAGSGKTRVLVERLLSYITDESDPKNIDNFLVITYTRAAAAELRSRILGALNELLSARPNDRRLRRQISLCNTAAIGTIHSFCTGLLREYGHLLDISPDFKIPDEDYAAQLKASALEKLLEARYAHIEEDAAFRALVDTVGAGLDDARLMRLVLSLHTKLRSQPYPETWAREQMGAFAPQDSRGLEDTVWGAYLLTRVRELLDYWGGEMKALCALLARRPVGNYLDSVSVTSDAIRALRRAAEQSWDAAYSRLPVPFPRLNTPKGMGDSDTATEVKRRRGACKKAMEGLTSTLFAPAEELRADLLRVAPAMEALLGLTLDFDAAYRSEKRRLGLLDFSDLEHFTAKLLLDEETGARTWLAAELCQRYTEILVDEYQDVNKIQDLIFHALSRQDRNLFLVGDVKQSIYRFRLADPALFLEKLNRFSDLPADGDITALRAPTRIPLRENFRSRAGLLEAVNGVFETLMTEELGEVDYKNGQGLIPSAIYPESDRPCCTLYTLALLDSGEDEEAPNRLEAEAEFVAGKIDGMLRTGAAPGDIAILLRSPSGAAGTFHAALSRRGIPVESAQGGSFFASAEILSLMSLLAVIDNPRQDVPLIAALGSPLFGFTPDQFSEIRAAESGDFYDALCVLAEDRDKNSADFLSLLASLRALASDLPVSELLAQIYARTSAEAVFAALPGGEARLRNLEALLDCATAFEAAGWRGLFAFNAWLNRLKERGEEPAPGFAPAGGNAVRILSIHKSKGLEFPIVFLSDTARQWNKNDLREPVLVHGELGLGPRVTDADRGLEYPSLAFRAVGAKLNAEAMSEELRVLYVAMTRAREQLHITCALRDPAETIEKLRAAMPPPLSPVTLAGASSPAMWLLAAGQAGQLTMNNEQFTTVGRDALGAPYSVGIGDPRSVGVGAPGNPRFVGRDALGAPPLENIPAAELEARRNYVYPHQTAVSLPSKLTATELKGRASDAEDREDVAEGVGPKRAGIFRRPDFLREARPLTGAEKGVATHLLMQHLDFSRTSALAEIQGEAARLRALGFLDGRQAQAADAASILRFFRSELGRELLDADELFREFRFSLLRPADEFFPDAGPEKILLQGVVDCCAVKDGELTVLDFKTDYVTADTLADVARGYFPQLRVYVSALEEIMGKKVRRAALYFFGAGESVELPPGL